MNAHDVLNIPVTATRAEIRKAYRELARRWHPDRFMEGPERDWANEKMAEINAAYRECLNGTGKQGSPEDADREKLLKVQQMIDDGNYLSARQMLMGFSTRCAEWNYLFGALLVRMSEVDKALIYLSIATHQNPDNLKYARAFTEARSMQNRPIRKFASVFARKR